MRIIIFFQYSIKMSNRLNVFYLFLNIAFLFSLKLHDSIFYEVQKTVFRKNYVQNPKTSKKRIQKTRSKNKASIFYHLYVNICIFSLKSLTLRPQSEARLLLLLRAFFCRSRNAPISCGCVPRG